MKFSRNELELSIVYNLEKYNNLTLGKLWNRILENNDISIKCYLQFLFIIEKINTKNNLKIEIRDLPKLNEKENEILLNDIMNNTDLYEYKNIEEVFDKYQINKNKFNLENNFKILEDLFKHFQIIELIEYKFKKNKYLLENISLKKDKSKLEQENNYIRKILYTKIVSILLLNLLVNIINVLMLSDTTTKLYIYSMFLFNLFLTLLFFKFPLIYSQYLNRILIFIFNLVYIESFNIIHYTDRNLK